MHSVTHSYVDTHSIDDNEDLVDEANAEVLEALVQDSSAPPTTHPELVSRDTAQSSALPPENGHTGTADSETNELSRSDVVVDRFPFGCPGAPMSGMHGSSSVYEATREELGDSVWAPFKSQCDWEFARWAKMRGPTSTAVTELLAIPEFAQKLGLSYCTSDELNKIIDTLPAPPPFETNELVIGGEHLQFHSRNIILCVKALFRNPEFAEDLILAPERHYTNISRTCRVYNELHTGDWWWSVQSLLETSQPGTTIVPILLSSDKTQLMTFRGKSTYPIYLGIGNIPKDIRRKPSCSAVMVVGYIPTTKLEGITNKAARCCSMANLFHSCIDHVLGPIRAYRERGLAMMSGDGTWQHCHPIFASFIGDYPEQALVTCTYNGRCPKCLVPSNQLGELEHFPDCDLTQALNTFQLADEDAHAFHATCREAGFKPVYHPFWQMLLLTNIFLSITPDVLHQLLQGVVKHLVSWLTQSAVFGAAEIDARCQAMPPSHHIMLFPKGITILSRVSGKEHKAMCRILLGLITDIPLPGGQVPSRVVRATRALLDFTFLAQFPSHMTHTLHQLEESLKRFHDNKDVFLDVGVREHFNLPKIHGLLHYASSIVLFGSTDNYNTEQMERLHIELTKNAFKATNGKDEYYQMTTWVHRHEKTQKHTAYIKWRQRSHQAQDNRASERAPTMNECMHCPRFLKMARHPTAKAVTFDNLSAQYGAVEFQDCLADFIAQVNYPSASAAVLHARSADTLLPFRAVPVFHRIKFTSSDTGDSEVNDAVIVRPEHIDTHGRTVPSRFDTVLVRGGHNATMHGNNGNRIAQVRVVFQIPSKVLPNVFPSSTTKVPSHLAYVEWFSPLSATPDSNSGMYKVSRLVHQGRRRAAIIPVERIMCSVHLLPRFGPAAPRAWKSFSVLESCNTFYVNPFSDRHNYLLFSQH
ncbi:hypothetical protein V8E53_000575 [Lactarius tabidus]